jgi:hypothetical protein
MHGERSAEWRKLAENTQDPADRSDLESCMLRECHGSYTSAEYDCQNLEMWRRVLSASIQSPPSVVERPAMRTLVEPEWLREVYRGTREDARRLLQPGRQESRAGPHVPLLAPVSRAPDKARIK